MHFPLYSLVVRFLAVTVALLAGVQGISISRAAAANSHPNFVFIIADDCTYRDLECYGGQAKTPHINQLVKQGMMMERCFQAAPMCSPTRHNIYTGLYPVRSGAYPNHTFAKPGTESVVQYLKPLGYRVHLSGKKHIGPEKVFPFEYSGTNNPSIEAIDQLFSECQESETPFCLFACSNEPHSPWNKGDASVYKPGNLKLPPYLPDTDVVRESFSKYLAEITYFDSQVGEILERLKSRGLDDSTMVMVVSEQGNSFPFAKWTCYEAGVASGMVVRWPGKIEAGSSSDAIVEYVDILPTFLEAAGAKIPQKLEGKSFLPVLLGNRDDHKSYTYSLMTTRGINNGSEAYPIRSVRGEQYRLIWNLNHQIEFKNACTNSVEFESMLEAAQNGNEHAREFTKRYSHRPEWELYDVVDDPHNLENLSGKQEVASIEQVLKERLQEWMESQGDKGMLTEMEAYEHQQRARNKGKKKKANQGKKKKNQT